MKATLQMALEALENLPALNWIPEKDMQVQEAITAIKEALAQQCVCGEPNSAGTHRTDGPCLAPQRTWVGLTKEEVSEIAAQGHQRWLEFYYAIEAKLKEKNA